MTSIMMRFLVPILMVNAVAGFLGEPEIGVAAYYWKGVMEEVCNRRVAHGWHPKDVRLDCGFPCLAAVIEPPHAIGKYVVIRSPSGSLRVCHVVDVGASHDLPSLRRRGEVIELDYQSAMDFEMVGYTADVSVWWVNE